jgi:hypothetical protein
MKITALSIFSAIIVTILSLGIPTGGVFADSIEDGLTNLETRLDVPTDSDVRTSLEDVLNAAVSYVSLIGVIVIIIAGFVLIFGAGGDTSVQRAKKIIIFTLVGILLIYLSRIIVGFITTVIADTNN